jgi:Flp pilus assembly protein TadD
MTSELREHIHWIENMMNEGDIEEALKTLQEVAHNYPESYHVASLIGECYLTLGQPEKAIKPLQWATRRFKSKKKMTRKKPEPMSEREVKADYDERTTVLKIKKAMRRKRKDSLWIDHYLLGCAFGRCMKFKNAIKHLNIANKLNPNNAEVIRNIGWIRCMQEKKDHGRKLLQKSIDLDPTNALAYNDLGASYMFEENFEEAQKWIKKASEMDPQDDFISNTVEKLEELMAYKKIMSKLPNLKK